MDYPASAKSSYIPFPAHELFVGYLGEEALSVFPRQEGN